MYLPSSVGKHTFQVTKKGNEYNINLKLKGSRMIIELNIKLEVSYFHKSVILCFLFSLI